MTANRFKVMIIGGFPPPEAKIYGGVVRICQTMLNSPFSQRFDLILIDSTQISNPPPILPVRAFLAVRRFFIFLFNLFTQRPQAVVLFISSGGSVLEKGVMAWVSRMARIPSFVFPRHANLISTVSNSWFHGLWISSCLKGGDYFLCQGQQWKRFATTKLGFMNERAPIIPNWTATNKLLSIGNARLVGDRSSSGNRLLFVGWLEREKGVFELLEACRNLLNLAYSFHLTIAGRGHAEAAAMDYVETYELDQHVTFAGWVEGEALEEVLKESDIFVLPSWREGLPNAMIEAMATGLAVIVTPVGNIPGYIEDGKHALLVPPQEVAPLQEAIEVLLRNSELRSDLAFNGYVLAEENFSVEPAMQKLGDIVHESIMQRLS